jgi:hypothetical protein
MKNLVNAHLPIWILFWKNLSWLPEWVAEKLKTCAENGGSTLGQLRAIAHDALNEISKQRTLH